MVFMKKRFWEIDSLRGVAILMMITFHFAWDLNFFIGTDISLTTGFWEIFRISTVSIFLILVGISLYISTYNKEVVFLKLLKRGGYIFFLALLITAFSFIFFPENYIIFGILHLIGVSIVISYFFLSFKFLNLFFGSVFILLGVFWEKYSLDLSFLFPWNFSIHSPAAFDHYPFLPWFGLVLWGIFLGRVFYRKRLRQFSLPGYENGFLIKQLSFLGRNSLFIYFVHQPILFFFFYIFIALT